MNTSIEAYRTAIADGRISKARARVLECACNMPRNFSQADIVRALGKVATDFRRFAPRVRELELMGVFKAIGIKTDPNSGMPVKTYEVTGLLPIPLPKRIPNRLLFEQMLTYLQGTHKSTISKFLLHNQLIEQLRQRLRLTVEEV